MSICVWNQSRGEVSVWVSTNTNSNGSKSWWTIPPGSWDYWQREGSETVTVYRHGSGSTNYETLIGYPGSNAIISDLPTTSMGDITVRNDNDDASVWVKVTNDTNPYDPSHLVELTKKTERKWKRAGPEIVFILENSQPCFNIYTARRMELSVRMGVPGGATMVIGGLTN